jgi:hypothetical protein
VKEKVHLREISGADAEITWGADQHDIAHPRETAKQPQSKGVIEVAIQPQPVSKGLKGWFLHKDPIRPGGQ